MGPLFFFRGSFMKVQIILAGVGGQGILFASRLFAALGLRTGLEVKGSETHGMSQRGGSVIAHVKLGPFHSPLVRSGQADILYAFDVNEAYRTLRFLKRGGACFVNLASQDRFDKRVLDFLEKREMAPITYDASAAADRLGSTRSMNIVLIGFSLGSGLVPFSEREMRDVLRQTSPKSSRELNIKAFEQGFKQGQFWRKQLQVSPARSSVRGFPDSNPER